MTVHRFFCAELRPGENSLSHDEARHACQVLRLRVGDRVELFDGRGGRAFGELTQVDRKGAVVLVGQCEQVAPPPGPALTILTALPRPQRQPFLFEKCTELGVHRIVPLLCRRSTVRPQGSAAAKWQRTLVEAAKQSGCLHLPEIAEPETLEGSIGGLAATAAVRVFGSRAEDSVPLAGVLAEASAGAEVAAWIGPEGGLDPTEEDALRAAGVRPVSLGPHVLRVETAVLTVAAAVALRR